MHGERDICMEEGGGMRGGGRKGECGPSFLLSPLYIMPLFHSPPPPLQGVHWPGRARNLQHHSHMHGWSSTGD